MVKDMIKLDLHYGPGYNRVEGFYQYLIDSDGFSFEVRDIAFPRGSGMPGPRYLHPYHVPVSAQTCLPGYPA